MTIELSRHLDGLLVPMLVAIAGAVTVAHWLDQRSTYTSRLRAASRFQHNSEAGSVSSATHFVDLLRLSVQIDRPFVVVDETGQEIGRISRSHLIMASQHLVPHEIATAIDVLEVNGLWHM